MDVVLGHHPAISRETAWDSIAMLPETESASEFLIYFVSNSAKVHQLNIS